MYSARVLTVFSQERNLFNIHCSSGEFSVDFLEVIESFSLSHQLLNLLRLGI